VAKRKKTAVVLIHGIGEQRPMDTLWGFVQAAWMLDPQLVHSSRNEVWSKPEMVSGSFELRRITTREASFGEKSRFDFFEFYWAHHMQGHTLGGLARWTLRLFVRPPSAVPRGMFLVWIFGVLLLGAAALVGAIAAFTDVAADLGVPEWLTVAAPVLLAVAGFLTNAALLPYAGDAARYLSPEPGNVEVRQKIREDGVSLLEKLRLSGKYGRIVLVGHSLGSVIAFDILNFAWNRLDDAELTALHRAGTDAAAALDELEAAARLILDAPPSPGPARVAYRDAQRRYAEVLADRSDPLWLVSDLITLGSPLSKADILIGHDEKDLKARIGRRELPSSPPALEGKGEARGFSFPLGAAERRPHHGAVFAPVVWSNVYVPNRLIWFGDIISGPLAHLFGPGVLDVRLPIGSPPGFRHLDYWRTKSSAKASYAIRALRRALNLRHRKSDAEIWGGHASSAEIPGEALELEN
jgi:hypothetical protein